MSRVPARFERQGDRTFAGRGFGYRVQVDPNGYSITVPLHGEERTVRVSIEGANPRATVSPEEQLSTRIAYLHGANPKDWKTNIPSYARVRYSGVLPGADLLYYGNGDQFEFDLALRPGFDAHSIQLRYQGQDKLAVDSEGQLHIAVGGQELIQPLPSVFQKKGDALQLISGEYRVAGNKVSFQLGPYDSTLPLVIDPVILYTGFIGGLGSDSIVGMRRGTDGLLYIAGNTRSTDLPTTDGAYQASKAGDEDAFIMQFDPGTNLLVSLTYFGGTLADEVTGMMLASDNSVILTGFTLSTDLPTKNASQSTSGGDRDVFLARFDLTQTGTNILQFATYFGGSGPDVANAITLDSANNIYIAGYTGSTNLPIAGNPVQGSSAGGWDAFAAVFDPFGTAVWSTYLGGDKTDQAQAIAVAPDGSVVIAGNTTSASFPLAGFPFDSTYHGGGGDGFVARMQINQGLNGLVYATFLGGNGADDVRKIAVDAAGRLVVAGSTASTDFPIGPQPVQATRRGETDLFLTVLDLQKINRDSLIYSTYFGGSAAELPYGMKIDPDGTVLLTGYTYSQNYPVTVSALQSSNAGAPDAFFTRLDYSKPGSAGLVYSSYLGGPQVDYGYAVESDPSGALYLGGTTNSRRFPSNADTRDSYPGDYDAFLLIVQPCSITLSQSGATYDAAGIDSFSFQVTGAADCSWTAASSADWLKVTGGASGRGNGTVTYSVAPNGSNGNRTAGIRVADQTYTVNQSGNQ